MSWVLFSRHKEFQLTFFKLEKKYNSIRKETIPIDIFWNCNRGKEYSVNSATSILRQWNSHGWKSERFIFIMLHYMFCSSECLPFSLPTKWPWYNTTKLMTTNIITFPEFVFTCHILPHYILECLMSELE